MFSSILLLSLAATPVKLAAPGFQAVNFDPKLADLYLDRFVVLTKNDDLSIVTARDISQVLGMERQRELLGCGTTNCVAELAGAMGADAMLSGTVAKSDRSITMVLRAIRANDASELVSATIRVDNEDALQDWIEANAKEFGEQLVAKYRGVARTRSFGPSAVPRITVLAAGVVLAGAGAITRGLAEGPASQLRNVSKAQPIDIPSTAAQGRVLESAGNVMLGVGGAAIVTAAILFVVQRPEPSVAFIATPAGVAVVAAGRF